MLHHCFRKPTALVFTPILLALALAIACGTSATPAPGLTAAPAATTAAAATTAPAAIAGPTAKPAATVAPATIAKAKLDRLKIGVAPLGWDTNFTWLQSRSGQLDKRPALEYLIGIDQNTGAYRPELAEKWEMGPDGKTWTISLRKGIKFIDSQKDWGEFTGKDVRHAVSLITQSESVQTDGGLWRVQMGIGKDDTDAQRA